MRSSSVIFTAAGVSADGHNDDNDDAEDAEDAEDAVEAEDGNGGNGVGGVNGGFDGEVEVEVDKTLAPDEGTVGFAFKKSRDNTGRSGF